jgi:hypothetical protein
MGLIDQPQEVIARVPDLRHHPPQDPTAVVEVIVRGACARIEGAVDQGKTGRIRHHALVNILPLAQGACRHIL